jgi:hypothetical protein
MIQNWKQRGRSSSPFIRAVRIFLLVLIIIGIGLIITRDMWVPKLVAYILKSEGF